MINVTPTTPMTSAAVWPTPNPSSHFATSADSVTAPNADDSSAVSVTPIWTAASQRVGLAARRATAAPRRPPRSDSALTCPSRSDTSAISAATNSAATSTRRRTTATFSSVAIAAPSYYRGLPSEVGDVRLLGADRLRGLLEAGQLGVGEADLVDGQHAAAAELGGDAE